MKTSNLIAAAAVALFAVAGAQAETYDGVLTINSTRSRAEVNAEAVAAAHAPDAYAEGATAGVAQVASTADRSAVRAQAVAAAHDPLQNLDRKAYVNSVIPSQYTNGSMAVRQSPNRQAGL
ncbi:alpha/beta hydrolase [Variovorax sp. J22R133]|uniref:alpha/beta hydrolase n=1 Tax=Variovorax brevis TaxID=3053503 RepID=UPI0025791E55|nr:alpha/beta hydrolase [Variovorax sp. J22R133]MDM0117418.1 alpha/beta hydrolase [Variovorax sp. J22R133]